MEKAFYLQERELAVLMAAMGKTKLYGYPLRHVKELSEQMVNMTLFQMVKKKIIRISERGIHIQDEYQDVIKSIIEAQKLYVYANADEKFPQMFLYQASQVIMLCGQGQDSSIIRVEVWQRESMTDRLVENGMTVNSLLQDTLFERVEPDKEEWLKEKYRNWYLFSLEKILKESSMYFILREYDVGLEKLQFQIMAVGDGMQDYLIGENSDNCFIDVYSDRKVKEMLDECRGSEK